MTCPVCHSAGTRRSKRRSLLDYLLFSAAGMVPWRCESCGARFHTRPRPFRHLRYAQCAICGNLELRQISAGRVPGVFALPGRLFRVPALRCEPCRRNFFSVRPVMREEGEVAKTEVK